MQRPRRQPCKRKIALRGRYCLSRLCCPASWFRRLPLESQSPPAPVQAATTDAAPVVAECRTGWVCGGFLHLATPTTSAAPAAPTPAAQAGDEVGFGVAMNSGQLDEHRGGDVLVGQNNLTGTVADNTAYKVSTGSNAITQGSFASSSGLPTVIQNTGANVLIQNATVLNVRFGD